MVGISCFVSVLVAGSVGKRADLGSGAVCTRALLASGSKAPLWRRHALGTVQQGVGSGHHHHYHHRCSYSYSRRRPLGSLRPRMAVREVDSQEEMERILSEAGNKLIVVDYGTTWCGPCKLMEPKMESWSEEYTDVVFLKVVGDKSKETSMMMKAAGIRSVPSFHFYKNGDRVLTINGAKAEEILRGIEAHM
jgi:thioredoxin 1